MSCRGRNLVSFADVPVGLDQGLAVLEGSVNLSRMNEFIITWGRMKRYPNAI